MTIVRWAVYAIQHMLLGLGHLVGRLGNPRTADRILVGLEENAGMLRAVAEALPGTVSVKTNRNLYYSATYDHDLSTHGFLRRALVLPFLLGRLTPGLRAAFYVGGSGFLLGQDGRAREFAFLRRHGVEVMCLFTGSDIRSHERMAAVSRELGRDVLTTYQGAVNAAVASPQAERRRKALAVAADRFASVVFNPGVDQASYLERPTQPFLYFHPDTAFEQTTDKWRSSARRLTVLHAPSSPTIKGTPLVRAAIKALKEDGYDFDYVEILGRPHEEVLAALADAHIALNEFYALMPGVFGIEAMAARAVLLTAADSEIETSLGTEAQEAWVVTPYWRVREKLQWALEHPEELPAQAERGHTWARKHCSSTACTQTVTGYLTAKS